MILIVAFLLGAFVGWKRAGRRGGDRLDRWQYAAVHAIAFTIAALALSIVLLRSGLV